MKNSKNEVLDDPNLLELMIQDLRSSPKLFRPTNYWARYEKIFLPELRSKGLHDFRRRRNSVLRSFGATDSLPSSDFIKIMYKGRGSISRRLTHFLLRNALKNKKIEKLISYISKGYIGLSPDDLNLLCYTYAKLYGIECNAKSLNEFEASSVGNPENSFYVNDKMYTIALLDYYVKYAYCCKFMNFEKIQSMTEIGSGGAKQIEVIKKLYPKLTFYVFDIPPQLYVAEQYLKALFPESVVSYRETREMESVNYKSGKIFIFAPKKIAELKDFKYDFFFNAQSFQEMEPDVVLNYLKFVNKQTKKYVYLGESTKGKEVAKKTGEHGVLKKTTFDDYKTGLKDFQLIDISKRIRLPKLTTVTSGKFMFWERLNS